MRLKALLRLKALSRLYQGSIKASYAGRLSRQAIEGTSVQVVIGPAGTAVSVATGSMVAPEEVSSFPIILAMPASFALSSSLYQSVRMLTYADVC
jgi:hypothetical protein